MYNFNFLFRAPPFGSVTGYVVSGRNTTGGATDTGTIDSFSFSTEGNSTTLAGISGVDYYNSVSMSSFDCGYTAGGSNSVSNSLQPINRFTFASNSYSASIANLTGSVGGCTGASTTGFGYVMGGFTGGFLTPVGTIEKFTFATEANAVNCTAVLATAKSKAGSMQSTTIAFTFCGVNSNTGAFVNTLDKIQFASDAAATNVGAPTTTNLTHTHSGNSTSAGYVFEYGDSSGATTTNSVLKMLFSNEGTDSSVGSLVGTKCYGMVLNTLSNGYVFGGHNNTTLTNAIERWGYASDVSATSIATMNGGSTYEQGGVLY